jgi:putative proteasome-type protease
VVKHNTSLADGVKLVLISMDSTLRSNLSVGLPIDLMVYREGGQKVTLSRRITEDDTYFRQVSQRWSDSLREAYRALPSAGWIAD